MTTLQWVTAAYVVLVGFASLACETMEPTVSGNLVPPTVAEDPTLPAVDLNGTRFHAQTMGDPADPVIVFLHGGPGADYRSLLRLAQQWGGYRLADEYFLVFWDQRGSGLSARHNKSDLNTAVYTADLLAVINHYAPGRAVTLVGESWGGMLATQFINTHPERVSGAVLIEPGPLDGATYERIKHDLRDFDIDDIDEEWLNDYAWNSQFISPDGHARMDYSLQLGRHGPDSTPVWRLGAAAHRYIMEDGQDGQGRFVYDFTTNLSSYTTPVLFVAGSLSDVLGPSLQITQVERYPNAALEIVNGAGHEVAWTHAADVVTHIRAYLNVQNGGAR